MAFNEESLRGYSLAVHKRDSFVCCYCGLDGKRSLDNWLALTRDHLLPPGHPDRDKEEYICTACTFCNTADNHYFEREQKDGSSFTGMTRQQLIDRRKISVLRVRKEFRDFWNVHVASVHA